MTPSGLILNTIIDKIVHTRLNFQSVTVYNKKYNSSERETALLIIVETIFCCCCAVLTGLQNFLLTDEYYLFVFSYSKQLENISNFINISISSYFQTQTKPWFIHRILSACFNPSL